MTGRGLTAQLFMITVTYVMTTMNDQRTRLRAYLEDRGIRITWVARQCGLSNRHFQYVMDGERVMTDAVRDRLFALYGIDFREPSK